MRRWLVAVFALHFFLSAGAFAVGHAAGPGAPQVAVAGLVAEAAPAAAADVLVNALTADHGLSDPQADFPECLDVPIATSTRAAPLRAPSPPLAHDLTPPVLDGPQRPPRGALATAA